MRCLNLTVLPSVRGNKTSHKLQREQAQNGPLKIPSIETEEQDLSLDSQPPPPLPGPADLIVKKPNIWVYLLHSAVSNPTSNKSGSYNAISQDSS